MFGYSVRDAEGFLEGSNLGYFGEAGLITLIRDCRKTVEDAIQEKAITEDSICSGICY